jgi:3-oxoacyl-[acyl-carrier protein] reductase
MNGTEMAPPAWLPRQQRWCGIHTLEEFVSPRSFIMNINGKVAIVTGASGGIGLAVATELAKRGAKAVALIDRTESVEEVARSLNDLSERTVAEPLVGDITSDAFRQQAFDLITARHGTPTICVPAAASTRDQAAVRVDAQTGCAVIYPVDSFRHLLEVNLVSPVYWAMEMIARLAEQRKSRGLGRWNSGEGVQGAVIFLGSASPPGGAGQIAYATAKAGLEGVESILAKEALEHGVRCAVIHPDFTRTPLVRALGDEFIKRNILPYLQTSRLNQPGEVADAVCSSISNATQDASQWAGTPWQWTDVGWSLPV